MSKFQLPDPDLWAVKMVQGAVAADCFGVEFEHTRERLRCTIYGPPVPSAFDMLKYLLNAQTPPHRALHHWLVGLRSLFGSCDSEWKWISEINGEREEIRVRDGQPVDSYSEGNSEVDTLTIELTSPRGIGPWEGGTYKLLCDRCKLCHIPVTFDRRLISQQDPALLTSAKYAVLWMESGKKDLAHFPVKVVTRAKSPKMPVLLATKTLAKNDGVHPCSHIVCVSPAKWRRGKVEVYWMRDGSLIGPLETVEQVSPSVSIQIICPGSGLQMDLSEWAPREPQSQFPDGAVLTSLVEIAELLRPRVERSVSFDVREYLPWIQRLGDLGDVIADTISLICRDSQNIGIPPEFVFGIDEFAKNKSLTLRTL